MRLIDADALAKDLCENYIFTGFTELLHDIASAIRAQPTVDAVPVRHGKWIVCDEIIAWNYHTVSECSKCGFTTDKMYRSEMLYCPHCGARMDEE